MSDGLPGLHCGWPSRAIAAARVVRSLVGHGEVGSGMVGKADPLDTMEDIRDEDPERELLANLLRAWASDYGLGAGSDVPLTVIVDRATKMPPGDGYDSTLEPAYPEFNAAVRTAAGATGNARVDVTSFSYWCRTNKGRIVDGLRLMNKPSKRGAAATWWVEKK